MSVLAIDVGTTMIKSVVFDDQGGELAVSRLETEVQRRHPGWAEQDMDTVWNAVVYTVRTALSALAERPGPADPVWLVTFTAQGDGAWLVDAAGRPTGPAILWSDGRAGDLLTRWERAGVLEEAFRRNGSLTCSGMPNAVISWLDTHDPDRLARSSACLTAAGWLFHHLTGVTAIDESDASAPFLDHATGDYDPGIVDLFGLAAHARLLPKVLGEDERIAEITADAAAQLGVQPGLPVVMAPYDIASTARGVGVVNPGQACGILGTTLCTEIVRKDVDATGEPSGINIAYRGRERVLRAFPTLSGVEVLSWAARTLQLEGPPQLGELAFPAPPGANGLMFLPYLSPAGERAPFLDPRARDFYLDWDRIARDVVASLRSAAGRNPYDRDLTDLVGELSTRSDEFRRRWGAHNVRTHGTGVKHFHHGQVGDLELNYERLEVVFDTGLTIFAYTADPGTRSADALGLLGSLAATTAAETTP